jgi:hypothetical protein
VSAQSGIAGTCGFRENARGIGGSRRSVAYKSLCCKRRGRKKIAIALVGGGWPKKCPKVIVKTLGHTFFREAIASGGLFLLYNLNLHLYINHRFNELDKLYPFPIGQDINP